MRLIILDPSLDAYSGHHVGIDMKIASNFQARGWDSMILSHEKFPDETVDGVRVVPHFSCTAYGALEADPHTRAYDEFIHFNQRVADDLAKLPAGFFSAQDLILAPTVTENILEGMLRWHADAAVPAPLTVFLMMPSGLCFEHEDAAPEVLDPLQLLFYKLAFRQAERSHAPVHFIGTGREHAREYGAMLGHQIPAFAPMADATLDRDAARRQLGQDPGRKIAVLYAGDCKTEKGFPLLPEVADTLCRRYRDWRFLLHFNGRTAWGDLAGHADRLRTVAADHANLTLYEGYLETDIYQAMIAAADIILIPYDRDHYRAKSSGLLWESVNAGAVALVPDRCWIARELAAWGGSGVQFAGAGAEAITGAFKEAAATLAERQPTAQAAAARFRKENALSTLYDLMTNDIQQTGDQPTKTLGKD